ncbi:ribonuclease III domain-containing protein [Dactylonectria macrodidyma]|uniref:Large ribosomal subunit protein mL44 n=1 Tax=Dactylonectria macrodidyma TaxID=307937 RepID=A0A9P9IU52_9HYPO|nr:ribonuclease III domain-containing protein [Dactylonectria macrodidyma]
MKRAPLQRCGGQLLQARSRAAMASASSLASRRPFVAGLYRHASSTAATQSPTDDFSAEASRSPLPSPPPRRAAASAKLAALHARLSLSTKIPVQTLARALVVPSADVNPSFNNSNLAFLGSTFINYHVLEYLTVKWPRLPMTILYEALRAFAGKESLHQIARRWGVEAAAAPGEEVDPGLLQWKPQASGLQTRWGYVRAEAAHADQFEARRGISSRVVLDDEFGDTVQAPKSGSEAFKYYQDEAYGSFVQAVVGSIYTHCGREATRDFVQSHILSRQIDLSSMFQFQLPTRELAMLCAREGFSAPIARLESETGRLSRTPVYVVGIYSGQEKLGEGSGPSLNTARWKASMNALKAWYLYSPGNKVRVPSDMFEEDAKPWKAPHIDIGEII